TLSNSSDSDQTVQAVRLPMKSAFRFFNSCYSRFMSALDDASSSGCQYLLVEEIKTKMAAGCYPCGRFRAHIAITAA
ncbi:hypothetical protein, partial [Shigella boydii]|uniref:hypothetical protein n=1 Tax=Shigella boydii TaxID=621 RepID=UPI0019D4ACEC